MKTLQLIFEFPIFMLLVSTNCETVANEINNTKLSWDAITHSEVSFKEFTYPVRPAFNDSKTSKTQTKEVKHDGKRDLAKAENASLPSNIKELMREKCPKFKYTKTKFNIKAMPDIWQTAYYELSKKMQCFKIHIKKVSFEEQSLNEKKYGNYSGKVKWRECSLEVRPETAMNRVHFLQGGNDAYGDYGVLDNVIIEKIPPASDTSDPSYILVEESPDQWLVLNNLMLMRDCQEGGSVVFSRLPWQPGQVDIRNALGEFGEAKMNGKMACYDEEVVNKSFEEDAN